MATIYKIIKIQELGSVAAITGIDSSIIERWRADLEAGAMDMIVAYLDEKPVGRVNIIWKGADEKPVIDELGIVPMVNALQLNTDQRGKGIGIGLMVECEKLVKSHPEKPQMLALGVEPDNAIAINLYEKLGYKYHQVAGNDTFESSWVETHPDGQKKVSVDCLLMVKHL